MLNCLGIDTSNYTTSIALYDGNNIRHKKRMLKVKNGELGLRQSEAVFQHINQIPNLIADIMQIEYGKIKAIGVSKSPRDEEGSYMPCFTVGVSVAKVISELCKVPMYTFSHQMGHIVSALYSANRLDLLSKEFLAFHVSGGTTEAVIVRPDMKNVIKCERVFKTLDLNAGQAIDRVGVMLGLAFPAGMDLEKLALNYTEEIKTKPCIKGVDCCLSGLENICKKMKDENESDNKIARFCIEYIINTLDMVCQKLIRKYGNIPIVFSGGVMSNSIINDRFTKKYGAIFASPEFSSDNAAGLAILSAVKGKVYEG